jgi:ABC-2 type transport system permease protein
LTVLSLLTVLTAYMPALVFVKGNVSIGHILVGYLGLFLLGSASIAIGLFGSAIARSQIVAMIVGAAILTPLVLLWALARAVDPPLNRYLSALALHHDNFRPFMLGRLDFGAVVYYLVITYFFLLAATKVLEARRWR